jgi:hypothetical protein
MALSAYDEEGRLKKHALQGTGLGAATDKKGSAQRAQFSKLHEEAMEQNLSEEQMKTRLQGRMDEFGGHQQNRLAEIAKQRGGMEERYAATEDPTAEKRFEIYDQQGFGGWKFDDEFRGEARADWEEAGGGSSKELKKHAFGDRAERDAWTSKKGGKRVAAAQKSLMEQHPELAKMTSKKELKAFRTEEGYKLNKAARKKIEKRNEKALKNYRADQWQSMYDWKAAKAYEERRLAVEQEIDETYIPLGVEAGERQGMIQDRLELYNLFLGE